MPGRFDKLVALVTGASEGIGRALSVQLAREGADLALAARNADRLAETARACAAHGAQALVLPADLGERAACWRAVDETVSRFGRLDVLVNNAGVSMYAKFTTVEDPGLPERMMAVNFLAAVHCTGRALPHLRAARGRVVAVASLAAKIVAPGGSVYAASKCAMRGFFDSLRAELRGDGVGVTVAYPGFVRTEIFGRFLDGKGGHAPDVSARIPKWATVSPGQCARRIVAAAYRRRREVPPTLVDRLILAGHALAPWAADLFWQQTLKQDFPGG